MAIHDIVEKDAVSTTLDSVEALPPNSKEATSHIARNLKANDERRYSYALDTEALQNVSDLKLAADGHTVLIPQPSTDPQDPLNWSSFRKHLIVFCISVCAFLPDNGSATGAVVLLTQSK